MILISQMTTALTKTRFFPSVIADLAFLESEFFPDLAGHNFSSGQLVEGNWAIEETDMPDPFADMLREARG